jgi:DNA invertase Pin-like site-specific DNA recombinase
MILGYTRVSKGEEQNSVLQRKALEEAMVERVFEEKASGARWDRPELQRLMDQPRPGDVVLVWKLDRLSRSLKDLLILMKRIDKVGAGFRSLTESIDTTTPAGRMMMQMVGSFAEYEREMIRERTQAGLQAARAKGRTGGRPPKLTEQQRLDIADNVLSGRKSGAEMARLYSISETTVSRIVSRARQASVPG